MALPRIITLSLILGFFGFALYSVESFTSLFMHAEFKLDFTLIGVVFTLSNLSGAVIQIYTGRLGDRIGHKPVLVTMYSIGAASLIGLYYVAHSVHNVVIFSLLFLILAASLWGSFPSFGALVATSTRDRVVGFTITRVALNVGTAIGPAVAGFLILGFGYPVIYLSAFLSILAGLVLSLIFKPVGDHPTETGEEEPQRKFRFRTVNRTIIMLSFSSLLLTILLAQDTVTLPNYASIVRNLTTAQIGLVFTSNGILVVLMQYPVTKAIGRIGVARGYLLGLLFFSIGVFSFAFDSTVPQFIVSEAIITLGEDFLDPSGSAIVSGISAKKRIGANMGVYNSFNSVGYSIGPLIGGIVITATLNPFLIWTTVTAPGFVSVILYLSTTIRKVGPAMKKGEVMPAGGKG